MAELRALAEDKRVALLCYERNAADCHRSLLFDALLSDFLNAARAARREPASAC